MAGQTEKVLRVVVFEEGDIWLAQGLERDICVQGANLEALKERFLDTIQAEMHIVGNGDLSHVGPAPNQYFTMWNERSAFTVQVQLDGHADGHVELALCA